MKHRKTLFETDRTQFCELTHDDAPFILELVNSPGWLRFIGDRHVHDQQQAINYLDNGPLKSYRENGFGLWLACLKATGENIGICGLLKRADLEHPDIGYALLPERQGQGLASEMVTGTIDYVRNVLGIKTILALVMPENAASVRVLEKAGLTRQKPYHLTCPV